MLTQFDLEFNNLVKYCQANSAYMHSLVGTPGFKYQEDVLHAMAVKKLSFKALQEAYKNALDDPELFASKESWLVRNLSYELEDLGWN